MPSPTTTRETLLDAALRLLEERGPGALRIRDLAEAAEQSTMGVYTHFGSKQGLLEQLYLHGFRRLEDRLSSVPSDGQGGQDLLAFALAYRAFALENEALYGLMFERATPDFVPSDASRLAGLSTFEMLATRVAGWRPDFTDPAADAHLVWATMHGLVTIELMHKRWGGPLVAHLQGDPEQHYATAISSLLEALHGRQASRRRVIEELSQTSAEFRAIWSQHDVRLPGAGLHRFHHPLVGDLDLVFEAAALRADPGLTLLLATADQGSPTEAALRRLAATVVAVD